ncbi:ABC transporter permease [Photobacterium aphoticum]|uniref:Peptide ABC transporter permease n=1 Tax=Photobacterium aphoticum TaxID=754436 RepID=A0A0J1GGX8_9GAMM|nr:ABC transporter permease [Photobacterium aphoticum]KLU98743.1 peptide ABC transporter permease [Photobacterium aphoticum]PSU54849.1 ABC transporter permease [Photobacterium aphoticum]GHA65042.1 peptide ABC transporter permease [Photobacterium aphoticum]
MTAIIRLAWQSLLNRKSTALLTLLTVAISVTLLLGVEKVRTQAKSSFANTISSTDLIVGSRSGQVNLLLYSVFRIGNATNNIGWDSYQAISQHPSVKWAIPISLGDSHRGFRVIGTNHAYFEHYRYGDKQPLTFQQGEAFDRVFETVLGADVAKSLGYQLDDEIIIAHGLSDQAFNRHDNLPFRVVGILAPTGTPVDRSVHVSLAAIEAIHIGWESGAKLGKTADPNNLNSEQLAPKQITAFMLGLKSRIQTFALQRYINTYKKEPLSAIMPGLALHELWGMMSVAEQALLVVSGFVVVAGLLGMLTSLLTSLNERRREMAILRAMGAKPRHVFSLLICEACALVAFGSLLGIGLLYLLLWLGQPLIQNHFGLLINITPLSVYEWRLIGFVQLAGLLVGAIPAIRAYRYSLSDGMTMRM